MVSILVTGGCGFIGSHMCKNLSADGYDVIILDDLSTGIRETAKYGKLVVGSFGDASLLEKIFSEQEISSVFHFAGSSLVHESMSNPGIYYQNNVTNLVCLLDKMVSYNVKGLIFSSSAAVYGIPAYLPMDESHPLEPINVYGRTKLFCEKIISDFCDAHDLNAISLRYFNAVGCDPGGELGERHNPETHLVPSVLKATLKGENVKVFGSDHDTDDGTCVRDYVHVEDLCLAHTLAMKLLSEEKVTGYDAFNLGMGRGFSVDEIINICQFIVARACYKIRKQNFPRRVGDPPLLIANSERANKTLGWSPKYSIESAVTHAWNWLRQFETN